MSATPELTPEPRSPRRAALLAAVDLALRILGGLLVVVATALTAVLELLLSTVRVGGMLIGVSALLAVVGNVALGWFALRVVGRGWALALPAVVWFALMVLAAGETDEGDILLAGDNWVGLVMIFAGSVAFAVLGFRLILSAGAGNGAAGLGKGAAGLDKGAAGPGKGAAGPGRRGGPFS